MKNDKGNRIDNYFYEGLDNLNIIPPADVWSNIEEKLPEKRSSRVMFIWIAAASISLFAAVGGWMYFYSGKSTSENTVLVATKASEKEIKNTNSNDVAINSTDNSKIEKSESKDIGVNESNSSKSISYSKVEDEQSSSMANNKTSVEKTGSAQQNENKVGNSTMTMVADNNVVKTVTSEELEENSQGEIANSAKIDNSITKTENNTSKLVGKNQEEIQNSRINPIAMGNLESPDEGVRNFKPSPRLDSLPKYEEVYAMIDEPQDEKNKNRWAIGGQMAPLYSYRNITDVNAPGLTEASMNDIEKAVVTYSSGIIVDYEASPRLTFQTGVSYMKMGQEINNVSNLTKAEFIKTDTKSAYLANASKEHTGNAVANSTGIIVTESVPLYFAGSVNADFMSYAPGNLATQPADLDSKNIEQSFEFIEVPFLAKYKIIDRKINVHLLGGVSTNFLVNNKSILKSEGETVKGKTTDVETLNYSSSVGFGVVYQLNKNFMLSIEPTFKYYLNSFNTTDAVKLHPYAFGIYSGLSFKF